MCLKTSEQGFPAGSVVKNPPADAGDVGSILSPASCPQSRPPTIASEFWAQCAWTWRAVWPAWRKAGWRFGRSLDHKLAALNPGGTWVLGVGTQLSIAGRLWLCPGWPHHGQKKPEQQGEGTEQGETRMPGLGGGGGWVGGGGQLKPQFHRVTFYYILFRLMVRRGVNQHRKNNKICDINYLCELPRGSVNDSQGFAVP